MKRILTIAALVGAFGSIAPVAAAERTVTLAVENMTCASCPYIVKTTIGRVPGVSSVTVSYEKKTATVVFDDAATTVDAIAQASMSTGYPANPIDQRGQR